MLYLIGPDALVNLSFENFQKMVWMTMVHVLRFRIVITHAVLGKFAYPRITRYADNIRFSHRESLKDFCQYGGLNFKHAGPLKV